MFLHILLIFLIRIPQIIMSLILILQMSPQLIKRRPILRLLQQHQTLKQLHKRLAIPLHLQLPHLPIHLLLNQIILRIATRQILKQSHVQ